jgi:phenylpropionate dioxygenase-like ring-hydroxylating dioxygenase large terminal subunit
VERRGHQQPLARTLLDEPVVFFRGASGAVSALEDRCCHRNLPLSHGRVEGDTLTCGYHGMVYDAGGVCVKVPGQEFIPKAACVRNFPVREQDGVVWFWPGDPSLAAHAEPPAYPFHSDPRWAHKGSRYLVQGHHELINDNLIDLSHVGYVHGKTIGGTPRRTPPRRWRSSAGPMA